jgi:hypothetical protein
MIREGMDVRGGGGGTTTTITSIRGMTARVRVGRVSFVGTRGATAGVVAITGGFGRHQGEDI